MTPTYIISGDLCIVPVRMDTTDHKVIRLGNCWNLVFQLPPLPELECEYDNICFQTTHDPAWQIAGDSLTITEEIARKMVESKANLYRDYTNDKVVCITALSAFSTFLQSLGINTVNLDGMKPNREHYADNDSGQNDFETDMGNWQDSEDSLTPRVIILKEVGK